MSAPYAERRHARSRHLDQRGTRMHLLEWGDASLATPERPTLVLMHGWMDVAASFQFLVDALDAAGDAPRHVIAGDWRGFGGSTHLPGADAYWFPDYLADLDALLATLSPAAPVDLLGHSMGGNVVTMYAGIRPERIRRLVNLEGFGMPRTAPEQAPQRYATWLDELRQPQTLKDYASVAEVAERLRKNNPRLAPALADWLAPRWAEPRADGRWHILGDPAHKRSNPVLYRVEEVLACWDRITAPVMWVEGDQTSLSAWWGDRYPRSEVEARLARLPRLTRHLLAGAGHMLHHDQPAALAAHLKAFLDAADVDLPRTAPAPAAA